MENARRLVGRIAAIYQHPVKSMAGRSLDVGTLDTHGLAGDRRFAFRRMDVRTGFPWLTAGRFQTLLQYRPIVADDGDDAGRLTHIETPSGQRFDIWSDELRAEVSQSFGSPVELMHLDRGIFDEGAISVIATVTIAALEEATGRSLDIRRFRPNIVVEMVDGRPFGEDDWVGGTLTFGDDGPSVAVTLRDLRCSMIGLDPETSDADASILKATVRLNETCAGIYAAVLRTGDVAVGDDVYFIQN